MQKNSGNYVKSGLREPTNEEIQAQAMLSVAHGADGLGWFIYQSSEWNDPCSTISYGQVIGHSNLINPALLQLKIQYYISTLKKIC